jgi:hypothetical protein
MSPIDHTDPIPISGRAEAMLERADAYVLGTELDLTPQQVRARLDAATMRRRAARTYSPPLWALRVSAVVFVLSTVSVVITLSTQLPERGQVALFQLAMQLLLALPAIFIVAVASGFAGGFIAALVKDVVRRKRPSARHDAGSGPRSERTSKHSSHIVLLWDDAPAEPDEDLIDVRRPRRRKG